MILTKPFINNIGAFPASDGATINFSVLGGDIITSYKFWIYNNATGNLVYQSEIIDLTIPDINTSDIRNFPIFISPVMGIVNNSSYNIIVQTYNKTTIPVTESPLSSAEIFDCYVSPSLTVQIQDGDNYIDLVSGSIIKSSSADLQIVFDTNDLNSPAILNSIQIVLYGIDANDNKNVVFNGNTIYTPPYQQKITGFVPNVDSYGERILNSIYPNYEIVVKGETIDNFVFSTTISNIKCSFSQTSASGLLSLKNLCSKGLIEINTDIQYYVQSVRNTTALSNLNQICQDAQNIYVPDRYNLFIVNKATGDIEEIPFPYSIQSGGIYGACSFENYIYLSCFITGNRNAMLMTYNKTSKEFELTDTGTSAPYAACGALCADNDNIYIFRQYAAWVYNKETQTLGERVDGDFKSGVGSITQIENQENSPLIDNEYVYILTYTGQLVRFIKAENRFDTPIDSPFTSINQIFLSGFTQDNDNVYMSAYEYNNSQTENYLRFAIFNKETSTFEPMVSTPLDTTKLDFGDLTWNGMSVGNNLVVIITKAYRSNTRYILLYNVLEKTFYPIVTINEMPEYFYTMGDSSAMYFINTQQNSFGSFNYVLTNISSASLSYREVGSSDWLEITTFNSTDPLLSIGNSSSIMFPFCGNNRAYEFRLTINSTQLDISTSFVSQVLSNFNNAYICNSNNIYLLTNEWTLSNIRTVQKSAVYEPYGSKFPFIAYNAVTKYRAGSSMAVLLAPTSQNTTSSHIDRYAQEQLVNNFNNFLTDQKAKILKDFNGNLRVISVYNDIANEYYKELGNGIASTSFEWAEISDFTQENINKIGLFNNLSIIYNN